MALHVMMVICRFFYFGRPTGSNLGSVFYQSCRIPIPRRTEGLLGREHDFLFGLRRHHQVPIGPISSIKIISNALLDLHFDVDYFESILFLMLEHLSVIFLAGAMGFEATYGIWLSNNHIFFHLKNWFKYVENS